MNSKKLTVRILLCLLALVSLFTVVGCKEEKPIAESYLYDKQLNSNRYYFEQGYPDSWTLNQGPDGNYLKKIEQYVDGTKNQFISDCGLVAQISPTNNADKVKYSVYSLKYPFMRSTSGDFLLGLVGESNDYPFHLNQLFLDDPENKERAGFVFDVDLKGADGKIDDEKLKNTSVFYNKIQFQKAAYTFTVDGVDWKGMMFVTLAKEGFYVITLESEKSVWDANYAEMENMLKDFRLRGWETKE